MGLRSRTRHRRLPASRHVVAIAILALALASPAAAASVRVSGRLAAWHDEPHAGVVIALRADASPWERALAAFEGRPPGGDVATTKTDAEGIFSLEAPAPGFWELVARGEEVTASRRVIAESSLELGTWMPAQVRRIEVEVLDAGGRPLPGARVAQPLEWSNDNAIPDEHRHALTDERGRATILATAQELWLVAHASGLAPSMERLRGVAPKEPGEAPPPARVVIRLAAAAHRRLRLLEPDGAPARGTLWLYGGAALAKADEGGRVRVPVGAPVEPMARPLIWSPTRASLEVGSLAAPTLDTGDARTNAEPVDPSRPASKPELLLHLEPPSAVSGVVRDATTSSPIGGALVFHHEGSPRTVARADGSFEVSWPQLHRRSNLSARAEGFLEGHWRGRSSEGEDSVEGVVLELRPGAPISGIVVDPGGRPVMRAEVSIREARARTSISGHFRLPPQASDRALRVTVAHPDFAVLAKDLASQELAQPELRLVLEPGREAVGWVVDAEERPVAGAFAWVQPFGRGGASVPTGRFAGRRASKTDAEGRFRFMKLATGAYSVMVERAGFAPAAVPGIEVPSGTGAAELGTIVLAPGHTLSGVAITKEGAPIAGVHLTLFQGSGSPLWRETTTGADGRFTLQDLPAASGMSLVIEPPAGWLSRQGFRPAPALPRSEPFEIVLEPALELSGRVEDRDGAPIAGATLSTKRLDESSGTTTGMRSNADGSFSIFRLAAGVYEVTADEPSFQPSSRRGIEIRPGVAPEPVVFVLERGAILSGRVIDGDGEAVESADVRVSWQNGGRERSTRADTEGRYRVEGLPLGSVSATPYGAREGATRDVVLEPGDNELDLVILERPELFVSGRVVDANGAPVDDATVVTTVNGRSVGPSTARGAEFSIPVEPDTELTLVAAIRGQAASRPIVVQVADSSVEGIVLELEPGGAVYGRIVGLEVDQLAQVQVSAVPQESVTGGYSWSSYPPDLEGRFRLEGLAPGQWVVRAETGVSSSRRLLASEQVTLESGGEVEVVLDATEGDLLLSGAVTKAGEPVARASVQVTAPDVIGRSGATTETSSDGTFELGPLRPGRYRLFVSGAASTHHSQEVDLRNDQHLTIELPTASITGTVVRRGTQEPVPWAQVSLVDGSTADGAAPNTSTTRSDAQGAFRFEAVPDGSHQVVARAEPEGRASVDVTVTGHDVEVTLELTPTTGVVLFVTGPAGQPPPWATVEARDRLGRPLSRGRYSAGEGGRVEVHDVPDGRWRLLVSDEASLAEVEVIVPGDPVAVQLVPGGYLEVAVPALESSAGGERLELLGDDGRTHAENSRQLLLRYGRARIGPLLPGTWTVLLRHGDAVLEATARLERGGVARVELR